MATALAGGSVTYCPAAAALTDRSLPQCPSPYLQSAPTPRIEISGRRLAVVACAEETSAAPSGSEQSGGSRRKKRKRNKKKMQEEPQSRGSQSQ